MPATDFVTSARKGKTVTLDWGEITWLVSAETMPGAEMTLGLVTIHPGRRNPLHSHPNCEEILHVVSGSCDHFLGGEIVRLEAGEAIRIPRGVRHWAKCLGDTPMRAVISFSSAERKTENHEDGGTA